MSKVYTLEDAKNKKEPMTPVALLAFSNKSDHFKLLDDYEVTLSNGHNLILPKGFVTDFASVPNFLKGVFTFTPYGGIPFIIHDYLYDVTYTPEGMTEKEARYFADMEMLKWMNALSRSRKDRVLAKLFYIAVRWFAGSWWRN